MYIWFSIGIVPFLDLLATHKNISGPLEIHYNQGIWSSVIICSWSLKDMAAASMIDKPKEDQKDGFV